MKIYGHPWSINTRKTLMTLAEKGHEAELVLIMVPKGEHKQPAHLARHPFEAAWLAQWINIADSYFIPHVHPLLVETLFRRHLGGEQNQQVIEAGRAGMQHALDVVDSWLGSQPYMAGQSFSLADIHFMPYVDYLVQTGQGEHITRRTQLSAWWDRVSARRSW